MNLSQVLSMVGGLAAARLAQRLPRNEQLVGGLAVAIIGYAVAFRAGGASAGPRLPPAARAADKKGGPAPEDQDESGAENTVWGPKEARGSFLQGRAKQPTIGKHLDDAMGAIERDNPALKGVLPKDFSRPALDKQRLGELIDLIAKIGLGDTENRSRHVLGR